MLSDNEQRVNSIDDAIFRGKVETPALDFYSTGTALGSAADFVKGWVDDGDTWVGTTRYFNRKVSFRDDGAAVVIYSSDESAAFVKDGKTGKVDRSPATDDAYVLYNTRLVRSGQGVWQTVDVASKRAAPECRP